jgi:hypothetical protein
MIPYTDKRLQSSLLVFFVTLLLLPVTTRAQDLGIVGGLNYASVNDVSIADAQTTYDNRSGYHIGLYFDIALGPIAVRPGIRYVQAGRLFSGLSEALRDETGGTVPDDFDEFDVNMFVIPVDLRLQLPFPLVQPYAFAGPELRFPGASDSGAELSENLRDNEMAGNLGLGAQVSLPGLGITLTPEARYTIGLTGLMGETVTVGGQTFETSDSQKVNMFFLSLGVEF